VLFFFRDPDRSPPSEPGVVVAAADGKVVCIEDAGTNDYLGGGAVQVSIFLSVFDVHVNRIPISGVVDFVKWRPGSFLLAYKAEASAENEQSIIGIRSGTTRIVVKQIAGILARRIVCRLQGRETVRAGDRFGLIRFGSRVDLILPSGAELRVAVGDRVRAGETIIGAIDNV
jgi:phosphatidylserine decarboxylase